MRRRYELLAIVPIRAACHVRREGQPMPHTRRSGDEAVAVYQLRGSCSICLLAWTRTWTCLPEGYSNKNSYRSRKVHSMPGTASLSKRGSGREWLAGRWHFVCILGCNASGRCQGVGETLSTRDYSGPAELRWLGPGRGPRLWDEARWAPHTSPASQVTPRCAPQEWRLVPGQAGEQSGVR